MLDGPVRAGLPVASASVRVRPRTPCADAPDSASTTTGPRSPRGATALGTARPRSDNARVGDAVARRAPAFSPEGRRPTLVAPVVVGEIHDHGPREVEQPASSPPGRPRSRRLLRRGHVSKRPEVALDPAGEVGGAPTTGVPRARGPEGYRGQHGCCARRRSSLASGVSDAPRIVTVAPWGGSGMQITDIFNH